MYEKDRNDNIYIVCSNDKNQMEMILFEQKHN